MIECKDVLALCDRFEAYLMPLDVHVLRRRYNGQTLMSTYAVGCEMGVSDETVRTIENRALYALAHCLGLEANGRPSPRCAWPTWCIREPCLQM
jgi:DNA-directed RNA polymerase sigma subunit (sigma70/sigma32)